MSTDIRVGDALDVLRTLPSASVQCCVCSPPYFGLRAYLPNGHRDKALELGGERTPELYIARLVEVFREVRRVLRADGTLWLNIGDSYAGSRAGDQGRDGQMANRSVAAARCRVRNGNVSTPGLKPKDLIGIPWALAFALRADGWWLRSEIIWHKPAPMPESVTDRCTRAHEQVFMLTKRAKYFYDAVAIAEPSADPDRVHTGNIASNSWQGRQQHSKGGEFNGVCASRNARSVWTIPQPVARLRSDLTQEQRAFVLQRLAAEGLL